ncbi:hypothetical protein EPH95_14425 [Salicibibacter halophilus]|uniref:Uncharacterized protein n=1 Tax=Salicibibacter halophilus TaxID=2502791 RepID=A0A514LK43_9BACI|nr:hypothetical protein [Salicibibacter halophilus]QDI92236.1 hypothetical protein EPH95_14425 [Salicibibacter halophilus]
MRWKVRSENVDLDLNIANYCCIFDNHSFNEKELLELLVGYFQPRSKVKDLISIKEIDNDYEDVTAHNYQFHSLSTVNLLAETQLGSKSLLKKKLRQDFLNELEFSGYLQTINSLIEDVVQLVDTDLPIQPKNLDVDGLIKLLDVDFGLNESQDYSIIFHQLQLLLPMITETILKTSKVQPLVIYYYPEHMLGPRQQVHFKKLLDKCTDKMKIIVLTKSRYFLSDNLLNNNLIIDSKQRITNEFFEDMEWNAPLDFKKEELEYTFSKIFNTYVVHLETYPTISNYQIADIQVNRGIELYVLIDFMEEMGLEYSLDIDHSLLNPVISRFVEKFEKE